MCLYAQYTLPTPIHPPTFLLLYLFPFLPLLDALYTNPLTHPPTFLLLLPLYLFPFPPLLDGRIMTSKALAASFSFQLQAPVGGWVGGL